MDYEMKGGFVEFPNSIEEATTFDDCIAIKSSHSHYIVLKFRDEFIKCRITKKKYQTIIAERKC